MKLSRLGSCLAALFVGALSSYAQVELIAGWNFGQFISAGVPSTNGATGDPVSFIPSNYSGDVRPTAEDSGPNRISSGNPETYFSGGGTLSYPTWDYAGATDIIVVELGGLSTSNSALVNGGQMFFGDTNNAHLRFISGAVTDFTISVGTLGFSDYAPAEYAQPNDANFTFAAYRAGGASATITWLVDGAVVGITTVASDSFNAFTVDLPASFYGRAAASLVGRVQGDVVIDNIQINGVKAAPATFTQQPSSRTVTSGADVTFSVVVDGATNPAYRWFFGSTPLADGSGVSGAATATLTLTGVTPARAGSYRVEVNNNGAVASSDPATLTVNVLPSFTSQPSSASANPGDSIVFEVDAAGSPAPSFQWFKGETPLSDDARVSGAMTAELAISGLLLDDAGDYTVLITNAAGSLRSAIAVLTVTEDTVAPTIQGAPVSATAVVGQPATFRVTASGAPAPTYQWFKDDAPLSDGPGVSGAATATLRVTPSSLADAGVYRVIVTNVAGSAESAPATLTVWTLPSIPAGSAPVGGQVNIGGRFVFQAGSEGVPAPTYQWFKDGEPIDGATGAQLVIDPAAASDAGEYTVVVTNDAGSVESEPASLEVTALPSIVSDPVSRIVGTGANVTFQVVASGSPELLYQWFKDGELVDGADGASLSLQAVDVTDAGAYTVVVSNVGGSVTSAVARLDVFVTVERSGSARVFAPGTQLALDSNFASGSGYRFQWLRNGKAIPGATGSVYLIDSAAYSDSGTYSVRISAAGGRYLMTIKITQIRVTVAGKYSVLLRNPETTAPVGHLSLTVASNGTFSGTLAYVDGKTYPVKGRFAFPEQPHQGTAVLVIRRSGALSALELEIDLDAREGAVACGLVDTGAEADLAAGTARSRLSSSALAAWASTYDLTLTPMPTELPAQPQTAALLKAVVARKGGAMKITGRLADNTKVTASVPSSVDAGYALWIKLYSGKGRLAGALNLVEVSSVDYVADLESSGAFAWFRPANPKSSIFPGGIDLLLAPELVKP